MTDPAPILTPDAFRAGFVASVPGARFIDPDGEFPDSIIEPYIAEFTDIAENYRGCVFTPHSKTWTIPGQRCYWRHHQGRRLPEVVLPDVLVSEITAATANGITIDDLSTIVLDDPDAGIVVLPYWGLWALTYTYGLPAPSASVQRACRLYTASCAIRDTQGLSRDVYLETVDGGAVVRYSTPDESAGRPTGYTDVDRLLNSVKDYRDVAG